MKSITSFLIFLFFFIGVLTIKLMFKSLVPFVSVSLSFSVKLPVFYILIFIMPGGNK